MSRYPRAAVATGGHSHLARRPDFICGPDGPHHEVVRAQPAVLRNVRVEVDQNVVALEGYSADTNVIESRAAAAWSTNVLGAPSLWNMSTTTVVPLTSTTQKSMITMPERPAEFSSK